MSEEKEKLYDFTCAKCGKELCAAASLSMLEFGVNSGHARCPGCKTFLHLELETDLAGSHMVSEEFEAWRERKAELKLLGGNPTCAT